MVLPLLLVGATVGGGAYLADKLNILDADDVGEQIQTLVIDTAVSVVQVIPTVLAELAPALVDGVASATNGVIEALEGREVAFMTGLTALLIGYAGFRSLKTLTGGGRIATN
tara:strand:+ start:11047 stop:11382 length:336 start_codon:yes stop_codon:yes gene_type:complete